MIVLLAFAMGVNSCGVGTKPPKVAQSHAAAQPGGGGTLVVAGEVLGVDRVPVAQRNDLTLSLKIVPGASKPVLVHFGPGWHLKERGLVFEPHEAIQVRGTTRVMNGQPVIEAAEVNKGGKLYRADAETDSEQAPEGARAQDASQTDAPASAPAQDPPKESTEAP